MEIVPCGQCEESGGRGMSEHQRWTLTVEEDPETGDGILTFPPDLLAAAGWQEGDRIHWKDNQDGSWSLEKIQTPIGDC